MPVRASPTKRSSGASGREAAHLVAARGGRSRDHSRVHRVDSELYASLTVSRLVAAAGRLIQFPALGRVVPEFDRPDLRELIVRPYRLVYRLRGESIEIATVFHAARMFPDLHASGPTRR